MTTEILEDSIIVYRLYSPPREKPMNATRELLEALMFEEVGVARQKLETMRRSGEILRYAILDEEKTPSIKITLPNLEEVTIGQI